MKNFYAGALVAFSLGVIACTDPIEEEQGGQPQLPEFVEDSKPSAVTPAKGFYVINEDWFGHDDGTVNYFLQKEDATYDAVYRAYRKANPNEKLGMTSPFGTTWGNYVYLLSKQGNRLIVADAGTLKKKAVFTELGGDGRSFVGVDDRLGYIGHSKGIRQFDLANLQPGEPVADISTQVGALCYAEGRVFAVTSKALYAIDVKTNQVEKTWTGSYNTLTRSKDGTIWVATATQLVKLNPATLEEATMDYPGGVKVDGSWGSWNAGSLCAGTQSNVLYWSKGSSWSKTGIVKYDIDTQTFTDNFYTLGKHDGRDLSLYGAGLRVDPITDRVVATVTRSYENYNWIHIIRPDGTLEQEIEVNGAPENAANGYYWFPAMPFFEDANKPEILLNMIRLAKGETKTVDLNLKVIDADNSSVSLIRRVEMLDTDLFTHTFAKGVLTLTATGNTGATSCKVIAISNGVRVEKNIPIVITE